ncbi:MAG: hypothetical protein RI906_3216 [Pseudomonadota bacterium]|jgi:ElaB/YqjD/DUF883 family membrane-anchored ribosome-binding protein
MDKVDSAAQISSARNRLAEDMRALIQDSEELLRAAQRQGGEQLAAARERLEVSLRHARTKLDDAELALAERARETARQTNHYVHEHPWTAISVAASTGILMGMLLARR